MSDQNTGLLVDYLLSAYSRDELTQLLSFELDDGDQVVAALAERKLSPANYAAWAALALQGDDLLSSARFWDALCSARPNWAGEIRTQQALAKAGSSRKQRNIARDLLLQCFSMGELRSFLRFELGASDLYRRIELGESFVTIADGLQSRGLINDDFWEILEESRPQRAAEIRTLKARWSQPEDDAEPAEEQATDQVATHARGNVIQMQKAKKTR